MCIRDRCLGTVDVTIMPGDQVALSWQSADATSCSANGNFVIPPDKTAFGYDLYVIEPGPGSSTTYTVTCNGYYGSTASDSIAVTNLDLAIPTFN